MSSKLAKSTKSTISSLVSLAGRPLGKTTLPSQPSLRIDIDSNHRLSDGGFISFSTMDTLKGTVSVTTNVDTSIDYIDISFNGQSTVFLDQGTRWTSCHGGTVHRFLTIKQPISEADLLPTRFTAGVAYTFPFTFTIPTRLLPHVCPHPIANQSVRNSHLTLPPTLNGFKLKGYKSTSVDALVSDVANITYELRVRIAQSQAAGTSYLPLAEKKVEIYVQPSWQEQPPLIVDPSSPDHRLSQQRTVRNNIWQSFRGKLNAHGAQPKAFKLPRDASMTVRAAATIMELHLRFDPSDNDILPIEIKSVTTRLVASTYYSTKPQQNLTSASGAQTRRDYSRNVVQETVTLSSFDIACIGWKRHDRAQKLNSDQAGKFSSVRTLLSLERMCNSAFFTAYVPIPLELPRSVEFPPTFHSCLISRTYSLSVKLYTHEIGHSKEVIHLNIPVNIVIDAMQDETSILAASDSGNRTLNLQTQEPMGLPPRYSFL